MKGWISENLWEEAEELGVDVGSLTFFKRIGGDLSSGGKALFEVMEPDSSTPIWVIKAARSPAGTPPLRGEYERLLSLQRELPRELRPNTPTPLRFVDSPIGAFLVETALAGRKASQLLRRFNQPDPYLSWSSLSEPALNWLTAYSQHAARFDWNWDAQWWERHVLRPTKEVSGALRELSPDWEIVERAILNSGESIQRKTFSNVLQHGDFTPTNMVVEGRRIGVFDWSPADPTLPPLLDLTHFLVSSSLYLGQCIEKKTKLSELSTPVCVDEKFLNPIRPAAAAYARENQIDPADAASLTLASLVLKILAYARRPEPILESLKGWIFATAHWVEDEAASRLLAPQSGAFSANRS